MSISEAHNGTSYRFDDIIVDLANFRVYKAHQARPLPPRAFDLLIYLIEHRDRVVEKQELFEQIWKESFVTDNALTRAIKEIRHELDDDAGDPRYIATVHKRGYRFIGDILDQSQLKPADGVELKDANENRDPAQSHEEPGVPDRNKAVRIAVASAILLSLVAAAGIFYFGRNEKQIRSLAVLPLENSTGNPEAEYMSDGITESLINSLSRLPQIKMIPRTTAFSYKRKGIDVQQLGRELGVDAVVTGRITQQGDNIVIQTELTNTGDGSQFWGERFSRKPSDIFLLQEEIAKVISRKLELKLSGEDERRLGKRYTEDARAYSTLR